MRAGRLGVVGIVFEHRIEGLQRVGVVLFLVIDAADVELRVRSKLRLIEVLDVVHEFRERDVVAAARVIADAVRIKLVRLQTCRWGLWTACGRRDGTWSWVLGPRLRWRRRRRA